jgi:hypothetical protein
MRYTILIILFFTVSCRSNTDKRSQRLSIEQSQKNDTSEIRKFKKRLYRDYEKTCLDSVKIYNINSAYQAGIESLYKIYGNSILTEITSQKLFSIGELDIRPLKFKYVNQKERMLSVELFTKDSLPINGDKTFEELGSMIYAFTININSKKINSGVSVSGGRMSWEDIEKLANTTFNSKKYQLYVDTNFNNLNEKLKRIVSRNGL